MSFCSKSCANDFKVGLTAIRQGSGSASANSKSIYFHLYIYIVVHLTTCTQINVRLEVANKLYYSSAMVNIANAVRWLTRSRTYDIEPYFILKLITSGLRKPSASCVVVLPNKAIIIFVERLVRTKRRAKDQSFWRSPKAMPPSLAVSGFTHCAHS